MSALITLHVLEASAFKISFMQHPQLTVAKSIIFSLCKYVNIKL